MSRSKSVYQGQVLRRAQRSEYDDSKIRDLARQDARLDHEIRTVERARNVMKKSMEADRQLFMKAGAQNNVKMTKSRHNARTQQPTAAQLANQHSRLVSDARVKRSSVSDSESNDLGGSRTDGSSRSTRQQTSPVSSQAAAAEQKHQRSDRNGNNNTMNNINNTPMANSNGSKNNSASILSTDAILQNSESLYENFLLNNLTSAPKGANSDTINNNNNSNTTSDNSNSYTEPSRRLVPKPSVGKKTTTDDSIDKGGQPKSHRLDADLGLQNTRDGVPTTLDNVNRAALSPGHTKVRTRPSETGSEPEGEDNSLRRPRNKWDSLATPKHSSPSISKRTQIELEFSAPTSGGKAHPPPSSGTSPTSPTASSGQRKKTPGLRAGGGRGKGPPAK